MGSSLPRRPVCLILRRTRGRPSSLTHLNSSALEFSGPARDHPDLRDRSIFDRRRVRSEICSGEGSRRRPRPGVALRRPARSLPVVSDGPPGSALGSGGAWCSVDGSLGRVGCRRSPAGLAAVGLAQRFLCRRMRAWIRSWTLEHRKDRRGTKVFASDLAAATLVSWARPRSCASVMVVRRALPPVAPWVASRRMGEAATRWRPRTPRPQKLDGS